MAVILLRRYGSCGAYSMDQKKTTGSSANNNICVCDVMCHDTNVDVFNLHDYIHVVMAWYMAGIVLNRYDNYSYCPVN